MAPGLDPHNLAATIEVLDVRELLADRRDDLAGALTRTVGRLHRLSAVAGASPQLSPVRVDR